MAAVGVASAGVGRVAWRRVCVDALEGALGRVYQVRFFRVDMVTRACLASNQGSRFLQYIQVPSARKRGKRGGGERERKEADCVYDARVMKERECVWRQITCVMRQSCTAGSCLLVSEKPPMSRSHRPQAWRGEPEIPCSLGDEQDEDDSKPDPVTTSADWPRATHLMRISCLLSV